LALRQGLEGNQLIGVGEHHRRLAERQEAGVNFSHFERRDLRRRAPAAPAQIGPIPIPIADVALVETKLAVIVVKRLPALAQEDLERWFDAGTISTARIARPFLPPS
jgi:hypothetical protein